MIMKKHYFMGIIPGTATLELMNMRINLLIIHNLLLTFLVKRKIMIGNRS
ncbi:hypothetical protein HanHA300_Chr01g0005181 [Helianthus annuus]|nr:hypothetical protein HanHA300_Chr01g0005181 [Helianthus annuus]